jgi:hypothetical protein
MRRGEQECHRSTDPRDAGDDELFIVPEGLTHGYY